MRAFLLAALLALLLAGLAPVVQASYGPESSDGFPINVDGEVIRPPVDPVWVPNLVSPYDAVLDPLNKPAGSTVYPYYPLLVGELTRLAEEHPDLVRLKSAGQSTAGLELWYLEIANWADLDAGEAMPLDEREVLYIDGGTHSNEYSGVYIVTELAQFLLDEYETNETAKWIVDNRHTVLLPLVNPDGSNAFGRINARTVNINRNYPVNWGGQLEDPVFNNPGPAAASEPETQHVIALMEALGPDYANSIHCCGNMWLTPYGLEGKDPIDLDLYTAICDEAFGYDPEVRDDCGPIWSVIYPVSGDHADTAYEYTGALTFGYEMSGRGSLALWGAPVVTGDIREHEREAWAGLMHAFLNVHRYGAHPVVTAIEGDADALAVTVRNEGLGALVRGAIAGTPLPPLAPGEEATVTVTGDFAAGETTLTLDWQKRLMKAPNGTRTLVVALADEGGRLVGVLDTPGLPLTLAGADDEAAASIPFMPALFVLVALAGTAVARRRART